MYSKHLDLRGRSSSSIQQSFWWRDITSLASNPMCPNAWLSSNIRKEVGNGSDIMFWTNNWCGTPSLMDSYPRLFKWLRIRIP